MPLSEFTYKKNTTLINEGIKTTETELHPDRYGGDTQYECKKVLQNWLSKDEYRGWLKGTIIKYLVRYGKKDSLIKEAEKIKIYSDFLYEFEKDQK